MKYTYTDSSQGRTQPHPGPFFRRAGHAVLSLATLLALVLLPALCLFSSQVEAAPADRQPSGAGKAQTAKARSARQQADVPRARPWAFGTGRSASVWGNQGVGGDELFRNAVPQSNRASGNSNSTDAATARARSQSGLEVSVDREDRHWDPAPGSINPGESKALDSQHRVRAFATVQDQNVSVGVGPEVIVRDESQPHTLFNKNTSQPEVDAGVGMRFKIDF